MGATERERGRWSLSFIVSTVIHVAAVIVLCWHGFPSFIRPRLLVHGEGGSSAPVSIALYVPRDLTVSFPAQTSLLSLPSATQQKETKKSKLERRKNILHQDVPADSAEAGSRLGSALDGSLEGDEIKPGFAITYPDPRVSSWELPGGIQGDVIVELTIDEQGKVVDERLLQGLGRGVDEKVIATLRDWRFRPATRNGIAIPFKYDAHFHFPS